VTFDPDVAAATVVPVAWNPAGVGVRWLNIVSGDPDVVVAVPAVIALVPGPTGVLVRRRGNNLDGTRWGWADANDDLGLCDACHK
jgi:hypothetical protein